MKKRWVVNAMPDWRPGMQDGKAVSVQMVLPIQFSLDEPVKSNDYFLGRYPIG